MSLDLPSSNTTSSPATSISHDAASTTPSSTIVPTITSTPPTQNTDYAFPPQYGFPPFFTIQRNAISRASQLSSWSSLIQAYCRHHHLFSLSLVDAINTPLFRNASLHKALTLRDAHYILAWMSTAEGGRRSEFLDPAEQAHASKLDFSQGPFAAAGGAAPSSSSAAAGKNGSGGGKVYVYWRRPEEWAELLHAYVDATGQKGSILTLYELTESEAVQKEEWRGMDAELLRRSLNVLVKKQRAQVFGQGQDLGVKFS